MFQTFFKKIIKIENCISIDVLKMFGLFINIKKKKHIKIENL